MPAKRKAKKIIGEYEDLILPDGDYAVLRSATPRLYRNIAIGFIASIIILVVFALFFMTTKASIVVVVKPQTRSLSNIITVGSEPLGANSLIGLVAAVEVSSTLDFLPSSGESQPTKATGRVTIYNKTKNNQALIATTRLLSPEKILFRIKKTAAVPAGGQVEVEAEADEPGVAGEIGPTRFIIPGLKPALQEFIYAESKAWMTGGEKITAVLSEGDIERAKKELTDLLLKEGQNKLKEAAKAKGMTYDSAEFTIDSSILAADKPVGTVGNKFKITGTLKVVGVFYNNEDLRQFMLAGLKTSLSKGDRVDQISPVPTVKLENYDLSNGTANLRADQEVLVKQSLEDLLDKSRVANLTAEAAANYLKSYSSVAEVSIKLEPFWVKKIPGDLSKIEITLVNGS